MDSNLNIGEFTTLYDSFGTPIHEGDTVEFFDWCYANEGDYREDKFETFVSRLPEGFIERAIQAGYTCVHKYDSYIEAGILQDCIQMYKPCVGVVKWNDKYVTYEPVVDCQEDYNNNSFHYVISSASKKDESYCKVIKKYNES